MTRRNKPGWGTLFVFGLVFSILLVMVVRLPFSPAVDSWLDGTGVLLLYGFIAIWVRRNRAALEQEPEPRDCVGRPIVVTDPPEVDPLPEERSTQAYGASGSLSQLEGI